MLERLTPVMPKTPAAWLSLLALGGTLTGCGTTNSPSGGTGGVGFSGAPGGVAGVAVASGGSGVTSAGAGGAAGMAPTSSCRSHGEMCNTSLDCCDGSTCNNTAQAPELNGCHPHCTQNSECDTGCCVLYVGSTNQGFCAGAKWCACGMSGMQCGPTQPKCCDDHLCLASNPERSAYDCKKRCTTNADCATKCCVAIPDLNTMACLDPSYCSAP